MNTSDKRWGGKRRPRITIPRAVTQQKVQTLYKVFYYDRYAEKDYYMDVLADTAGDAERIALPKYSGRTLRRIERTETNVRFEYHTYDVRYRGEHQDLLSAK